MEVFSNLWRFLIMLDLWEEEKNLNITRQLLDRIFRCSINTFCFVLRININIKNKISNVSVGMMNCHWMGWSVI